LAFVGLVTQRGHNHFFTWIGLLGNGVVIVGLLGLYVLGAMLQDRHRGSAPPIRWGERVPVLPRFPPAEAGLSNVRLDSGAPESGWSRSEGPRCREWSVAANLAHLPDVSIATFATPNPRSSPAPSPALPARSIGAQVDPPGAGVSRDGQRAAHRPPLLNRAVGQELASRFPGWVRGLGRCRGWRCSPPPRVNLADEEKEPTGVDLGLNGARSAVSCCHTPRGVGE